MNLRVGAGVTNVDQGPVPEQEPGRFVPFVHDKLLGQDLVQDLVALFRLEQEAFSNKPEQEQACDVTRTHLRRCMSHRAPFVCKGFDDRLRNSLETS